MAQWNKKRVVLLLCLFLVVYIFSYSTARVAGLLEMQQRKFNALNDDYASPFPNSKLICYIQPSVHRWIILENVFVPLSQIELIVGCE
jgi:hypothetical protein